MGAVPYILGTARASIDASQSVGRWAARVAWTTRRSAAAVRASARSRITNRSASPSAASPVPLPSVHPVDHLRHGIPTPAPSIFEPSLGSLGRVVGLEQIHRRIVCLTSPVFVHRALATVAGAASRCADTGSRRRRPLPPIIGRPVGFEKVYLTDRQRRPRLLGDGGTRRREKTEGKGDGHRCRGLHRQSAIGTRKLRHRIPSSARTVTNASIVSPRAVALSLRATCGGWQAQSPPRPGPIHTPDPLSAFSTSSGFNRSSGLAWTRT